MTATGKCLVACLGKNMVTITMIKKGTDNPRPARAKFSRDLTKKEQKQATAVKMTMIRNEMPNSAGSIFAILAGDIPSMDGKQAVFGKVIEGLDVVDKITMVRRDSANRPYWRYILDRVEKETFGVTYEKPQMLDLYRRVFTFR